MDIMKLNLLNAGFIKDIITSKIRKFIMKKFGYDVEIQINKIDVQNIDGKLHLHLDVDSEISNEELMNLLKELV